MTTNKIEVEYKFEEKDGVEVFTVDGFSYPQNKLYNDFSEFIDTQIGYMLIGLAKGEFSEGCHNLFHAGYVWHIYRQVVAKDKESEDENIDRKD